MNIRILALGAALGLCAVPAAQAAVPDGTFPPRTVRDLVAICAPAQDDPRLTGSLNYCHGYAEGAVIVELAHSAKGRKLFCLPDTKPDSGEALGQFITWANAEPARLDRPAIDGLFLFLAEKFPCPATTGGRRHK